MLNRVLRKIVIIWTAYAQVLKDFAIFVKSQGLFSNTPPMNGLDLLLDEWWDLIGANGCTFIPIACRILVQMCFTSSCKWNWVHIHLSMTKCETN